MGGTWNAGADGVTDTIDECSLALCQFDGCQCVSSFTRLTDGDDHILLVDDRFAVTELTGVFHLDGNLAEVFNQLLANQSCVPRGSASHDDDAAWVDEVLSVVDDG